MNSNKDDFSKINTIIAEIEKNPQSFPFLEPVDHVGLGLTDYLTIIAHPMDLSSVKAKLKGGNYNTYQDALNDIQLIWDNCKKYNLEGSVMFCYLH